MIDQPKGEKPALTVVIQSWWTPALVVVALVVGLLGGYFGRPLFARDSQPTQPVAAVNAPAASDPTGQLTIPTATVNPTIAAIDSTEKLMAYLVENTTHFKGDPNAKVTIIEFSDYQ